MAFQIPVWKYNGVVSISTVTARLSQISRSISLAANRNVNSTQIGNINIDLLVLELINLGYTEKQITGIDDNVIMYNWGIRLSLYTPPIPPPPPVSYLYEKYFSGDLSGVIGESVFVYYLTENLGISPYYIAHLRPQKRKDELSPDFIIYDRSKKLASLLGTTNYQDKIYAEVKGCMGDIDDKRIERAIMQLSRLVTSSNQYGLIFLLNRPRGREKYKATIVVVRG